MRQVKANGNANNVELGIENGQAIPLAIGILAPVGITPDPAIGAVFMAISTVIVSINAQLMRGLDLSKA